MTTKYLTMIDTLGIQGYVFASNKLKENIGASELVRWATEELPRELSENRSEIIYCGGGNAVLLFDDRTDAVKFTKQLSRSLLEKAPGLDIAAVHHEFDWDSAVLGEVLKKATQELARKKGARNPSAPLLGLGVTAECQSSGLVASRVVPGENDEPPRLVSTEIYAKLLEEKERRDTGRLYTLQAAAPKVQAKGYQFVRDLDKFFAEEEKRYLAVVHIDGNGMGKRMEKVVADFTTASQNAVCLKAMRDFSTSLATRSEEALRATLDALVDAIEQDKLKVKGKCIPFRLLIFGGDDITFVCEGKMGLTLAAHFVQEFAKEKLSDGEPVRSCAGVAIVKAHYPFARAYQLAEDLCKHAKKFVRDNEKSAGGDFSAIDWHIAASGLLGTIDQIREREYAVSAGSLCTRPLHIGATGLDWKSWETFVKVVNQFSGEAWSGRHNKVMRLREALRDGGTAVEQFRTAFSVEKLPNIDPGKEFQVKGWHGKVCGYFDAIEVMDFFIPLEEK